MKNGYMILWGGEKAKIIFAFDVLWCGWELDSRAWVVETEHGKRKLIMSNHGGKYFAKPKDLERKIIEYEIAIENSKKALEFLKK